MSNINIQQDISRCLDILNNNSINNNDLDMFQRWAEYLSKDDNNQNQNPRHQNTSNQIIIKKVSNSQLRKFLDEIKRIQLDFDNRKKEIVLLDPKLAYAAAKLRKYNKSKLKEDSKLSSLYSLLSPLLKHINQDKDKFKNFMNIYEAIVAYYKQFDKEEQ